MTAQNQDRDRDAVIAALIPVADGIAAALGSFCEVVVHDFRRPERPVVAIAGSATGRGVFAVRRAVEQVAARPGVSRASAHHYLARARAASTADGTTADPLPPDGAPR